MNFKIVRECKAKPSFRVSSLIGKYDLTNADIRETFEGSLDIEEIDWQIGVIFGRSGTGKTQIARELWPKEYEAENFFVHKDTVLEDMPQGKTIDEIGNVFNSVGFSSVKSWLKPYTVLSEGEKMRARLARTILSDHALSVFDEYTSTIDRDIAKVGSLALSKSIRRNKNKKIILVTCHRDVLKWLDADWTFCTDDMSFVNLTGRSLRRPRISCDVYRCENNKFWSIFRKYHYLNESLLPGSEQYIAVYKEQPIAFCAITHIVHRIRGMKRIHRLVVLPDYQGIGIGRRLLNTVCKAYKKEGHKMFLRTSNPALVHSLARDRAWLCVDGGGRNAPHAGGIGLRSSGARNRLTTGWEYVGINQINKHLTKKDKNERS